MYEKPGIYSITNVTTGDTYIGQSSNIKRRICTHKNSLRKGNHSNNHLQSSFEKYGEKYFVFDVVEYCDLNILDDRETFWIQHYDSYKNGFNQNLGGQGNRGREISFDARKKMSLNHADVSGDKNPMWGKSIYDFMSKDEIELMRQRRLNYYNTNKSSFFGRHHDQKTRKIISEKRKEYYLQNEHHFLGVKFSKEHCSNISKALKEKYKVNPSMCNIRKIVCLNTGETFNRIVDAAKKYNVSYVGIVSCCRGKIKSSGVHNSEKLTWMYKDDYEKVEGIDTLSKIISKAQENRSGANNHMSKAVQCITTGEIFCTATEAGRHYSVNNSSIGKCCKGKKSYAGRHPITEEKLLWKYQ